MKPLDPVFAFIAGRHLGIPDDIVASQVRRSHMVDEICGTCGCLIGGGCPDSTDEERQAYRERHPELEDPSSYTVGSKVRISGPAASEGFYNKSGIIERLDAEGAAMVKMLEGKYVGEECRFLLDELTVTNDD